jgi:hypothetical protein
VLLAKHRGCLSGTIFGKGIRVFCRWLKSRYFVEKRAHWNEQTSTHGERNVFCLTCGKCYFRLEFASPYDRTVSIAEYKTSAGKGGFAHVSIVFVPEAGDVGIDVS